MNAEAAPPSPGLFARFLLALLKVYQVALSPVLHLAGGGCRFQPTCSAYAVQAIQKYGAARGAWQAAGRLLRCHPLHPGGFDPP